MFSSKQASVKCSEQINEIVIARTLSKIYLFLSFNDVTTLMGATAFARKQSNNGDLLCTKYTTKSYFSRTKNISKIYPFWD